MRDYVYNSVQVSGVSTASGRPSGQFDLKRNFIKMKLGFMKFLRSSKFDGFVKNPLCPLIVIPALQLSFLRRQESSRFKPLWIPAFAGMTPFLTFYDPVKP
jgi:hypothetical protein